MGNQNVDRKAIKIFKDLVRINTTNENASEVKAALYLKDLLSKESIEAEIVYSPNGRANLIAKITGNAPINEPLVLLSHLDVVSQGNKSWTYPPFSGKEVDGFIWGRGTLDTKQLTIMHVMAFMDLKRAEQPINRDVYFVATADEENGSKEGMEFLAKSRPDVFSNATVLSEGGGFTVSQPDDKEHMLYSSGEKGTAVVKLRGRGEGGHAGSPPDNQAIKHISDALSLLLQQEESFPGYAILEAFEAAFEKTLSNRSPVKSDDQLLHKLYQYMKHQTITVDYLTIGEQINVIPYKGEVILEFRTLPFHDKKNVEGFLVKTFRGSSISWEITSFQKGYESEHDSEILKLFKSYSPDLGFTGNWVPFTALGKTDGRFISTLAKNIYGLSPVTTPFQDVLNRVHNVDERIEISSFLYGMNLMRKVVHHYVNGGMKNV